MQDIHKSLSSELYGYIDKISSHSQDNFVITGWVAKSNKKLIEFVRIKDLESAFVGRIPRIDVAKYYNNSDLNSCGFQLQFETDKPKIMLQVMLNGSWVDFMEIDLSKHRVSLNSKFNKVNDKVPTLMAIDDFYTYPNEVRKMALTLDYNPSQYHKGKRTQVQFILDGTKEKLEKVLGKKITNWSEHHAHCGVFQHCTPADPIVYHYDGQSHAAVVFLTPDAPPETGTSFYRHKSLKWLDKQPIIGEHGVKSEEDGKEIEAKYIGNVHDDFLDGTKWEEVDKIGNKFNRLAIWDAKLIHAASQYFGKHLHDSRLFHMFFFDLEQ
uniref:Uncharacterized protein n=1 Tax=Virus NIOZ-UU157 TaxID=2763269 RepID=A0A7S9SU02_9VIRU|nr:MAG: hypothetical protein NIOZUU157_00121 [Virus NIOZ-UU157]